MTKADEQIQECIANGQSFLLDAGAGSGKTSSLVKALNHIRVFHRKELIQSSQKVACITYTNVAKDEIIERTEHDPLFAVSTIHDFLWSIIKPFQKELKNAVNKHNRNLKDSSRIKKDANELSEALSSVHRIEYSDRGSNFLEGRIYHDDLLAISLIMFQDYSRLSHIVASRYPYIFVDEYQDTQESIILSLLDHIAESPNPPLIGFFGDKVQSIYSDGVGEVSEEHQKKLELIEKEENYRCSVAVINLLNKLRTDIRQVPAADNEQGMAVYINLDKMENTEDPIIAARKIVQERFCWSNDIHTEKLLFLTHRLISRRSGYENLWTLYNNRGHYIRERFHKGEDQIAAFFCNEIEVLISTWKNGQTGRALSLLNSNKGCIASKEKKIQLNSALDSLVNLSESDATIGDILLHVKQENLLTLLDEIDAWLTRLYPTQTKECPEDDELCSFYERLFSIQYQEITQYRMVLEQNTPYSTKHGVKGDEFDTVFVIVDDAGARWTQYSFGNLLSGNETKESRHERTRNLFYVCCSRAKRNLAVIDLGSPQDKMGRVTKLFGAEFCYW